MDRPPAKRKVGDDSQDFPRKKNGGGGGDAKLSFAERMMKKMGYSGSGGIGANLDGREAPIEVVQRPTRVGLGSLREKSTAQKLEERRVKENKGEVYVDSSEDERAKKRERKKKAVGSNSGSGRSTPARKLKFSVAEVEAEGLHVPSTLRGLITDMRGPQKQIAASDLRLGLNIVPAETEAARLAKNATRDLQAYAESYHDLSEESKTIQFQEQELSKQVKALELEIDTAKSVKDIAMKLSKMSALDDVLTELEAMPFEYRDEALIISVSHPLLRQALSNWDPLDEHTPQVIPQLLRIHAILETNKANRESVRKRTTTLYESLIFQLVLPRLREVLPCMTVQQHPSAIASLVKQLEPILPKFIANSIHNDLVNKVVRELQDFSPRTALKKKKQLPHTWVIPMLEVLPERLTRGLLDDARRKVRQMIELWPISSGPLPGLTLWKAVLPDFDKLLLHSLVPLLGAYLRSEFSVDPTDQDLSALTHVMSWFPLLPKSTSAAILIDGFFPPLLAILHQWLDNYEEVNYEEVGQFYIWWKEQTPQELNELPAIAAKWNEGLEMINRAIDGNLEAFGEEVEQPAPEATRPVDTPSKEPLRPKDAEEVTYKDIVESWCGEENLLLIPLREAHPTTGFPLFRITANAVGRGGVVVYMKGDVLYAAEKKDKSLWKPIGLGSELVDKAEGK
jgi:tuftelin-interacting protein 11